MRHRQHDDQETHWYNFFRRHLSLSESVVNRLNRYGDDLHGSTSQPHGMSVADSILDSQEAGSTSSLHMASSDPVGQLVPRPTSPLRHVRQRRPPSEEMGVSTDDLPATATETNDASGSKVQQSSPDTARANSLDSRHHFHPLRSGAPPHDTLQPLTRRHGHSLRHDSETDAGSPSASSPLIHSQLSVSGDEDQGHALRHSHHGPGSHDHGFVHHSHHHPSFSKKQRVGSALAVSLTAPAV